MVAKGGLRPMRSANAARPSQAPRQWQRASRAVDLFISFARPMIGSSCNPRRCSSRHADETALASIDDDQIWQTDGSELRICGLRMRKGVRSHAFGNFVCSFCENSAAVSATASLSLSAFRFPVSAIPKSTREYLRLITSAMLAKSSWPATVRIR